MSCVLRACNAEMTRAGAQICRTSIAQWENEKIFIAVTVNNRRAPGVGSCSLMRQLCELACMTLHCMVMVALRARGVGRQRCPSPSLPIFGGPRFEVSSKITG